MSIDLGDGVITVRGDMKSFNKSLDLLRKQAGKSLLLLGSSIAVGLGLAVKTAADFEQAITNAASVTGAVGADFEALKVHLEDVAQVLGRTTVFTAREAANALTDLARKGFDVASISAEDMQGILDLAAATSSDLQSTTQLVTSTINRFGLTMADSANIADIYTKAAGSSAITMEGLAVAMQNFGPVASAMGMSLEETTALIGKLADAGLDFSTIGTGLRNITIELATPTSRLSGVLEELGLSQDDLNVKSDGLAATFGKLVNAGITAEQVLEGFGKRGGPVALSLFQVGINAEEAAVGIDEFISTLGDVGDVAAETAAKQLDTLNGQVTLMRSAFEGVLIPLGKALIPGLKELATKVAGVLQKIAAFATENEVFFNTMVKIASVVGVAAIALGSLLLVLPSLVAGFSALIAIAGAVVGALLSPWALIAAAAVAAVVLIIANWDKVVAMFQEGGILSPALEAIVETFNVFKDNAMRVWNGVVKFFSTNKEQITDIFNTLKDALGNVGRAIVAVIRGMVSIVTSVLKGFGLAVGDNLGSVSDTADEFGGTLLDTFENMAEGLEGAVDFIANILEDMVEFWEDNSDTIIAIVRFFVNIVLGTIIFLGKGLLKSINFILKGFNLLSRGVGTILGGIANFVEGAANRIGDAIGGIMNAIGAVGGFLGFSGFAAGTTGTRSPFFIAGEGGKQELVAAPVGSRVFNANETSDILANAAGGGGESIQNNFNGPLIVATITKEADADAVIKRLERRIIESTILSGKGKRRMNRSGLGVGISGG